MKKCQVLPKKKTHSFFLISLSAKNKSKNVNVGYISNYNSKRTFYITKSKFISLNLSKYFYFVKNFLENSVEIILSLK